MATVYILDNSKHTGHAAIELNDGTYVSFHPKTQSEWGPVVRSYQGEFSDSLADDTESSDWNTPPRYKVTERVRVRGLDEDAMKHAYHSMCERTSYQLFQMNCSTVVAKLLIVGAGHAILDGHVSVLTWRLHEHAENFFGRRRANLHGRLTERAIGIAESSVMAIMRTMEAEKRMGRHPQARPILQLVTAAIVAADVVVRDFVWTPGDVLSLAEYINEHLPSNY